MTVGYLKVVSKDEVAAGRTVGEVALFDADGNPVDVGGGESGPVAWGDVTGKPTTFPPAVHNHTVEQVTGLQTALDGKAASSHTHTVAQVTGLQAIIDDLTARIEALESA